MRINQFKNEENNKRHELWKWTKKVKVTKQEECQVVSEIQPNLNETVSPIEIFSLVTGLRELLELIVKQTNKQTFMLIRMEETSQLPKKNRKHLLEQTALW